MPTHPKFEKFGKILKRKTRKTKKKRTQRYRQVTKPKRRLLNTQLHDRITREVLSGKRLQDIRIGNRRRYDRRHSQDSLQQSSDIRRDYDYRAGVHHKNLVRTTICKGRKQRRQSLFAIGKAGKGVAGPKLKKWTNKSKVRC